MRKASIWDKLKYKFDNRMSKGTGAMIQMLAVSTLAVAIIIGIALTLTGSGEDNFVFNVWDSLANIINAWMPSSEDGGILYILFTTAATLMGLFVTSVLIGIVSSAIEDKINELRVGNSKVIETGHIVVLGVAKGEYELIKQLILSFGKKKGVIVIADEYERDKYEESLFENVEVPSNVKLIYRNVDTASPVSLECLSIPEAGTVIVNHTENDKTVRALLAVGRLLDKYKDSKVSIVSSVTNELYMLPENLLGDKKIIMLKTDSIIAGIVANSLCQERIASVLMDIFNYEGSEFYVGKFEELKGLSFEELALKTRNAIAVGYVRNDKILINPSEDNIYGEGDKLIYLAENFDSIAFDGADGKDIETAGYTYIRPTLEKKITIIGINEKIDNVCREMDENITEAVIIPRNDNEAERAQKLLSGLKRNTKIEIKTEDVDDASVLERIGRESDHIVLLTDDDVSADDADFEVMMLLIRLRDIKKRMNLDFQITAEVQRESNRLLMKADDNTDFVVALNMAALTMAQVAVEPVLFDVFKELLSARGNEIHVKSACDFGMRDKTLSVFAIRKILLELNYIFVGYTDLNDNAAASIINPDNGEMIELTDNIKLIVIGND